MPYMLVRHKVEDYSKWKPMFDQHGATRKANGSKSAHVFRSADDPNDIVILFEWDNLENARRFTQSQDLREVMQQAGVSGPPDISFLNDADRQSA